ncbi:hypothetical protein LXL04_012518 [Taraxacum kok-saghyz]
MPPEPLPFDRKEFLKDRKPSSSDAVEIVPQRWIDPATTPSQYRNHGSSLSCRWGGGGGPSDFRQPFSGLLGKRASGGWHTATVESGNKENSVSMAFGSQKDLKGAISCEPSASPNGNSLPHNDFVNSSDQLQSVDQHAKNSGGGGFSTTSSQRLEKENSLGSWKHLKWIRSGSLSSRGSGLSHSSGCKIIGVMDPFNITPLRSPSEDSSAPCLTPRTPDDATSRKKQRLGWGEGLAKYEKKKVDPEDALDKEIRARNGSGSGSEPLLTSPSNLSDKSPSVNGYPECASPTTPYSFACSSSPGVEEKESTKTVTVENDTCNPSLTSSIVQTNDSSTGCVFLKPTAMDKLHLKKAEVTRTLEVTETEIDSLENELKSLVSKIGDSCPSVSTSFLTKCTNKTLEETLPEEKTDSSPEELNGMEDPYDKSPGTTSEFIEVEPVAKCSEDHGNDDGEVPTGSSCTDSDGEVIDKGSEEEILYDLILENRDEATKTSNELSKILPTANVCANISKATDESLVKKRFLMRKRFLKLKERVITSKYQALHYSWKEELCLLSTKKSAKSHKKFESSSRMGYADSHRCRSSGGGMSLIPTTETLDYVKKLLSDSSVRTQRSSLKMPCLILDKSERTTRFISDNALVENPVEVEKEKSIINAWSKQEKETFLEKYALFGKNFKKIASFLQHRTIADCVEFYYKNHKSETFQTTKKNSKFAKGKSLTTTATNTYLVTSGRRLNCEVGGTSGTAATSLEMLGAVTEMVANVATSDQNSPSQDPLKEFAMLCNEQETAAADVLAGICGSISSEALGSCITSSVDHGDVYHHPKFSLCTKRWHLKTHGDEDDEGSCSDNEEEEDEDTSPSLWTDEEKTRFIMAVRCVGKDFMKISRRMKTKSVEECRVYFSKARKCLGLDVVNPTEGVGEGEGGGIDPDLEDDKSALMVENKAELESEEIKTNEKTNDDSSEPDTELTSSLDPVKTSEVGVGSGLCMSNLFSTDISSSSSRLSFRKSCDNNTNNMYQRCSNVPKHSLLESCQILRGYPVDSPQTKSGNGDVKLFGQILTKPPQPQESVNNNNDDDRKPDVDLSKNVTCSHGYWDGNRIRMEIGVPTIPDSARLLTKYPAAFFNFDNQKHLNNGGGSVEPYTLVDKLLSTTKVKVVGGISDPVAAIRTHYQQYTKNGSNDIDNR